MEYSNRANFRKILIAAGAALIANLALFGIGNAAGATWDAGQESPVGLGLVAGASVGPMLIGGLVAWLISSKTSKPLTWLSWGVLAFAVLGSPLGWVASGDTATGLALGGMHVVEGLAFFWAVKPTKN